MPHCAHESTWLCHLLCVQVAKVQLLATGCQWMARRMWRRRLMLQRRRSRAAASPFPAPTRQCRPASPPLAKHHRSRYIYIHLISGDSPCILQRSGLLNTASACRCDTSDSCAEACLGEGSLAYSRSQNRLGLQCACNAPPVLVTSAEWKELRCCDVSSAPTEARSAAWQHQAKHAEDPAVDAAAGGADRQGQRHQSLPQRGVCDSSSDSQLIRSRS